MDLDPKVLAQLDDPDFLEQLMDEDAKKLHKLARKAGKTRLTEEDGAWLAEYEGRRGVLHKRLIAVLDAQDRDDI